VQSTAWEPVSAYHVSALKVASDDLVVDGDEGLIHAITAFASSFEQA
jgi:hypothetical protein